MTKNEKKNPDKSSPDSFLNNLSTLNNINVNQSSNTSFEPSPVSE